MWMVWTYTTRAPLHPFSTEVLSMTSLPPTVVPPMPTSLAAPAASPAVPLWPTAATVAAPVGERARPRELREAAEC